MIRGELNIELYEDYPYTFQLVRPLTNSEIADIKTIVDKYPFLEPTNEHNEMYYEIFEYLDERNLNCDMVVEIVDMYQPYSAVLKK
jgi:hypothetical protein